MRLGRRREPPSVAVAPDPGWLRQHLPLPPPAMRELVGEVDAAAFDQPVGTPVFATVSPEQYASVLDFGCGCGRIARRLALAAAPLPERYLGLDLHADMVAWDQKNLQPCLPTFRFEHHDVYNHSFNPGRKKPRTARFPVADGDVTLLVAWSVFTHLVQDQAEHYLNEVARVLAGGGVMIATWFLFDKSAFPMMQDFQHALYINDVDPTNAVIFERDWLLDGLECRGLRIRSATPPAIRGFQWLLEIEPGHGSVALPEDVAELGRRPPPTGDRYYRRQRPAESAHPPPAGLEGES